MGGDGIFPEKSKDEMQGEQTLVAVEVCTLVFGILQNNVGNGPGVAAQTLPMHSPFQQAFYIRGYPQAFFLWYQSLLELEKEEMGPKADDDNPFSMLSLAPESWVFQLYQCVAAPLWLLYTCVLLRRFCGFHVAGDGRARKTVRALLQIHSRLETQGSKFARLRVRRNDQRDFCAPGHCAAVLEHFIWIRFR